MLVKTQYETPLCNSVRRVRLPTTFLESNQAVWTRTLSKFILSEWIVFTSVTLTWGSFHRFGQWFIDERLKSYCLKQSASLKKNDEINHFIHTGYYSAIKYILENISCFPRSYQKQIIHVKQYTQFERAHKYKPVHAYLLPTHWQVGHIINFLIYAHTSKDSLQ